MKTGDPKRLRADAARNSERIARAARQVLAEQGPDAPLEEIARRADVGIATLYRRFPDRQALLRAALDQCFSEGLAPAIARAAEDENPRRALVTVLEAAMALVSAERHTVTAGGTAGVLSVESSRPFFEPLVRIVRRAQNAGAVRADLAPDDVPRLLAMLIGVLWTMDPAAGGWRRYLALMLDALSPVAANPLPGPPALLHSFAGSLPPPDPFPVTDHFGREDDQPEAMTDPAESVSRPARRHPAEHILDRAAVLFAQHGFAQTSLKLVADAAGLSKTGLLHHYPSKDALYEAVLELVGAIEQELLEQVADLPRGPARDRRVLSLLTDIALDRPGLVALLFQPVMSREDERLDSLRVVTDLFGVADQDADRFIRVMGALGALGVLSLQADRQGDKAAWRPRIIATCFDALGYKRPDAYLPDIPGD